MSKSNKNNEKLQTSYILYGDERVRKLTNDVLVSILCTAYNHQDYIEDALKGFLNQKTGFRYEVIVHDDASTDNTANIIMEYSGRYPEIFRPIIQKENQYSKGKKILSEYLFGLVKGKYLALCEGDDYWTDENKLQKQVDYMENNPDCSLCFHSVEMIKAHNGISGVLIRPYMHNTVSSTAEIIMGGGGFCPTASLLFPSRFIHDLPDFYHRSHVGDYPLQLYLAAAGYAYYIDESMAVYRTGVRGSWTSRPKALKRTEAKRYYNFIYEKDMILLNEFNEFTNFKFNDAVEDTVKRREFEILINNCDIKAIKSSRNRDLYEELGVYRIFKIYIDKYFPFIYDLKNQFFR